MYFKLWRHSHQVRLIFIGFFNICGDGNKQQPALSSDYIWSSTVFPSLTILFHSDTFLSLKSTWISAKISFLLPFREEQEALSEKRRKEKNNNKETKDGLCPCSPKCGSVGPITCLDRAHLWSYLPLDQLHYGLGWFFWGGFFLNEWMNECSWSGWGRGSWGFELAHSCVASADSHGYRWRAQRGLSECKLTMWVLHTPSRASFI